MTITKKQWMMLLLGAGVLFLVYWFFFRNKKTKTESSYDDNLMIFGNENGYGPADGAYGSYGNESNWNWPWWFRSRGLEGGSGALGYKGIKPNLGPPKPVPTFPTEERDESNWKFPWYIFKDRGLEGGSGPLGYKGIKPNLGPPKPIPTFPEGYGL